MAPGQATLQAGRGGRGDPRLGSTGAREGMRRVQAASRPGEGNAAGTLLCPQALIWNTEPPSTGDAQGARPRVLVPLPPCSSPARRLQIGEN